MLENFETLSNFIAENKNQKSIQLFCDVETLQFNEAQGRLNPSNFKNVVYSFSVSFYDNEENLQICIFPNFDEFQKSLFKKVKNKFTGKVKMKAKIYLYYHNSNRYDNHYLRKDILYYFPQTKIYNAYIKQTINHDFETRKKELTVSEKEFSIFEKRVKSRVNLDLNFYLYGVEFQVIDNYPKTNTSLKVIGEKMLRLKLVTEEELKTEFNYTVFNQDYDMTDEESREYALECFNQLTQEQLIYIRNDVILLAKAIKHFSEIFPNFDYSKMTYTQNILENYNNNNLTSFQLLNRVLDYNSKPQQIKYTDYTFYGMNFYNYLKLFYKGGLNFYCEKSLGKIIHDEAFSVDLNSSYPFIMHNDKLPFSLDDFESFDEPVYKTFHLFQEKFTLLQVRALDMNSILDTIESEKFRKITVKYYANKNGIVSINSNFLNLLMKMLHVKQIDIPILNQVTFNTKFFGNREEIEKNYFIKSQGKLDHKLNMKSPYEYEILNELNDVLFSSEEVGISKVILNGLYGIPALRPYFNVFKLDNENNEMINFRNGFKNNERNILFSIYVTSKAFYNLLEPLTYLDYKEIDDCLLYTDTDSLYLKKKIMDKLPTDLFDSIRLGGWDIEKKSIKGFYVLNHKKYALWDNEKNKVVLKCGGVPLNAFNMNYDNFEEFIKNEFHDGKIVKNKKNIYTNYETIAIYDSETKIEKGFSYSEFYSDYVQLGRELAKKDIEKHISETGSEVALFYETDFGTITQQELFNKQESTNNNDLMKLIAKQQVFIRNYIESEG